MSIGSFHKAGFVNVLGYPNAGKSTLINQLMRIKINIVSPKAQTTRHRVLAIDDAEEYQIVYSDMPGILQPAYELQRYMRNYVMESLQDADVFILLIDLLDDKPWESEITEKIKKSGKPVILVFNKVDAVKDMRSVQQSKERWLALFPEGSFMVVSAMTGYLLDELKKRIIELLPFSPPYFPKNEGMISDRNIRFFVAEIIREQIFYLYHQEIPYATEVYVEEYKERENLDSIKAVIVADKESQKPILIGKGGKMLKTLGIKAREEIEKFLNKKVHLSLYVKVDKDWRKKSSKLKKYGFI